MGPRSWADQNVEGLAAGMAWLPSGQATYRRRAAACRAGLTHPPSAGLMVVPGGRSRRCGPARTSAVGFLVHGLGLVAVAVAVTGTGAIHPRLPSPELALGRSGEQC